MSLTSEPNKISRQNHQRGRKRCGDVCVKWA